MMRNDVPTYAISRTRRAVRVADDSGTTLRTMVRGMVLGAGVSYVACVLALGFVVGWGIAALIAVWPAVFVGPVLGGFVALSLHRAEVRLAPVVALAQHDRVEHRDAA